MVVPEYKVKNNTNILCKQVEVMKDFLSHREHNISTNRSKKISPASSLGSRLIPITKDDIFKMRSRKALRACSFDSREANKNLR